jgi:hypothetical protein
MSTDGRSEPVIEIDLDADHVKVAGNRPLPGYLVVFAVLILGILMGAGAVGLYERLTVRPAPVLRMHTVVVTEDGISETFTMPTGSVVSGPPVRNSCSITVDGQFVAALYGVVGDAECGATVR